MTHSNESNRKTNKNTRSMAYKYRTRKTRVNALNALLGGESATVNGSDNLAPIDFRRIRDDADTPKKAIFASRARNQKMSQRTRRHSQLMAWLFASGDHERSLLTTEETCELIHSYVRLTKEQQE